MRDLKRMVMGLGAGVRPRLRVLRDIPAIAEVEAMIDLPGGSWAPAFEERCSIVSLSLFGITAFDADAPEPHPDNFGDDRSSRYRFSEDDFATYDAALSAWHNLRAVIAGYDSEVVKTGAVNYWKPRGFDITDGRGAELRCFRFFSHQLYVSFKGVLPGACITLDASGHRAPQSVDEWGAALAAEAARFRRTE